MSYVHLCTSISLAALDEINLENWGDLYDSYTSSDELIAVVTDGKEHTLAVVHNREKETFFIGRSDSLSFGNTVWGQISHKYS